MSEEKQHSKEETAVTHDVQYEDEETKTAVSANLASPIERLT